MEGYCKECPKGRWSATAAAGSETDCKLCPSGRFSTRLAAFSLSSCEFCTAGRKSPVMGASSVTVCKPCAKGQYQDSSGSIFCNPCIPGKYSELHNGSKFCLPCPIGKFQNQSNKWFCITAPSGLIVASSGQPLPLPCPSGKFSTSASQCEMCPRGWFQMLSGQDTCSEASEGYYVDSPGATSQSLCPSGTFRLNSSTCSICPSGWYQGASGRSSCRAAELGMFVIGEGAKNQLSCPAGKFSLNSTYCRECSKGRYRQTPGGHFCSNASSGMYVNQVGATRPLLCPVGRFSLNTSFCGKCSPGLYQKFQGQTTCMPCQQGRGTSREESTFCMECPKGKFSLRAQCVDCPSDTFSSREGASTCLSCPRGWFTQTNGSSICTENVASLPFGTTVTSTFVSPHEIEFSWEAGSFMSVEVEFSWDKRNWKNATKVTNASNIRFVLPGKVWESVIFLRARGLKPLTQWSSITERWTTTEMCGKGYLQVYRDNSPDYGLREQFQCSNCPRNGECSGSITWTEVRPVTDGYWGSPDLGKYCADAHPSFCQYYECPLEDSCNTFGRCNTSNGYDEGAVLCASCLKTHYLGSSSCRDCKSVPGGMSLAALILMCVVLTAIVILMTMLCKSDRIVHREVRDSLLRDATRSGKIVVNFFQVICAISVVYPVGLPDIAADFLRQFNVLNFDMGKVFRIGCFQPVDFIFSISVMIGAVLFLLLIDLLWYCYRSLRSVKRARSAGPARGKANVNIRIQKAPSVRIRMALATRNHDPRFIALTQALDIDGNNSSNSNSSDRNTRRAKIGSYKDMATALSAGFYILLFSHMPLSLKVFSVFQCRQVDDRYYLLVDMRKECYVGEWLHRYLPVSLALIIVVVIGFPLAILVLLVRKRKVLHKTRSLLTFGFLYAPYKADYYWYEVLIIFRKLLLSGVLSMLYHLPRIQISVAVVLSVIFHLIHAKVHPFRSDVSNNIEYASLFSTELTFVGALAAATSVDKNTSGRIIAYVIVSLTIITLLYALIMTIQVLVKDFRHFNRASRKVVDRDKKVPKKASIKRQPTILLNNDTVAHAVHMDRALSNLEKNYSFRDLRASKTEKVRAQAKVRLSARLQRRKGKTGK